MGLTFSVGLGSKEELFGVGSAFLCERWQLAVSSKEKVEAARSKAVLRNKEQPPQTVVVLLFTQSADPCRAIWR